MKKYEIGEEVSGQVTGITKYGVFVKLEDNYVGLVHISEVSNKFVSDLEKLYVLDETIDAKIVSIDDEKKQIKLSVKEYNTKNKRRKSIKEEGRGFEPLKENLGIWVKEKLEELEKQSKTL